MKSKNLLAVVFAVLLVLAVTSCKRGQDVSYPISGLTPTDTIDDTADDSAENTIVSIEEETR